MSLLACLKWLLTTLDKGHLTLSHSVVYERVMPFLKWMHKADVANLFAWKMRAIFKVEKMVQNSNCTKREKLHSFNI